MAKSSLKLTSRSPEETQQIGRIIGGLARPGDIILLSGPLGAGKTCLAQGIAQGLGVKESTTSPSYVLLQELAGRLPMYHMDFYRLEFKEIAELGLDDYLYGCGVCVIEWAEKAEALMPDECLAIGLAYTGESERNIDIVPNGTRYETIAPYLSANIDSLQKDKT